MKRRTKQWNERGSTRIAFRGSLLLKIEETGGRRKASYKRQVKTRDVPAIYLCRRGPPARNLRHFLFFSSSPFPPSPFLFSSSFSSLYPRIFFFLFFFFSSLVSSSFLSLSRTQSLSLSLHPCRFVPFYGFTSRADFTNGHTVPFWGNVSHVVPSFRSRKESCFGVARLQGNEIIENDTSCREEDVEIYSSGSK